MSNRQIKGQHIDLLSTEKQPYLQVRYDLQRAKRCVDHVQAKPVFQNFVCVQSPVTEPSLDVLQICAPSYQPPQHVFPRIDHLEEMLSCGTVHLPTRSPPYPDLDLLTELTAVAVLKQSNEDTPPSTCSNPDNPQRVALCLAEELPELIQLLFQPVNSVKDRDSVRVHVMVRCLNSTHHFTNANGIVFFLGFRHGFLYVEASSLANKIQRVAEE